MQKAGIISYGVYIPLWRLSRDKITKGAFGEKTVAHFDEDSVTMAVAAATDCLKSVDRSQIDAVFFASTTSPYAEKGVSSIIAAAVDAPRNVMTADFGGSLRAGTSAFIAAFNAVNADSAKQILLVAADCRLGAPGSPFEQNCGDGAVAFVIGNADPAVIMEGHYCISSEMTGIWRVEGDKFIRSWEDRFVMEEGYLPIVHLGINGLIEKYDVGLQDFKKVVFDAPDRRRHVQLASRLGLDLESQVQNPLFDVMGNTGVAHSLMLLTEALDEASEDDCILLASYGDGSDVLYLRTTDKIRKLRKEGSLGTLLNLKKEIPDYDTYLEWKGLLSKSGARRRPAIQEPSAVGLWRESERVLRLYGSKCKACGTVQYPIQRICTKCGTQDKFEKIRLSDKQGKIFTYSIDYAGIPPDTPRLISIINFEGGGRMMCYGTDFDVDELKIGMQVGMSFRKLYNVDGFPNYFWKCSPTIRR